ncbi:protein phosphatase 1 regulatory subunit 3D [Hyperolius riggenbachi]|uniref:protein phosphatase 1 regulatory subunit 3D n=1 Tax=Hyperolius riggenbachi TaxID=752182 RepID=UPI0035A2A121
MSYTVHPFIVPRSCKEQGELCLPRSLSYINNLYQNVQLAEGFGGQARAASKEQRRPREMQRAQSNAPSKGCDPEVRPIIRRRTKSLPSSPERKTVGKCRPRCQKVRFADSLGLELAEVKVFNAGDNPSIPLHVLSRLSINSDLCCSQDLQVSFQYLEPDFKQPADDEDFLKRLRKYRVCLERVASSEELGISGTIRVLNLAFEKTVTVRYSFTDWKTHYDVHAVWQKKGDSDIPDSDVFAFTISLPTFLTQICSALQFAVRYAVGGEEFWDNNQGRNYTFTSRTHTLKMPKDSEQSWIHFI